MLHILETIHHNDCHLWYTSVKWYLQFFHFFKVLIFQAVSGVKVQKFVQNEQKFCQPHSISQEPYIIWFSFMVEMCKIIKSPGIDFIFFKILFFQVVRGVKRQKIVQNDQKFCLSYAMSQESYIIWSPFVLHKCKMISLRVYFIFI